MAFDDDEILHKRASHPVTTTLLIVTALALSFGMGLTLKQLGQYVNPEVRKLTRDYTVKPIEIDRREFPDPQQEGDQPDA